MEGFALKNRHIGMSDCPPDDQLDHELSNNEVETTQTKPETSNDGPATDDQVAGKWCLSNFIMSRISNDMLDAPTAIKDHCQQQQINNNKDVDSKNEQVSELTDANDSQEIEKETLRSKNNSKKKPRGRLGKKRKVADRSGNKTKNNRQTKTVSNKKKVEKGKASVKIVTKCTSDDQLDHELSNNEVETTQTKPETSNEGPATDDQVAGKWCLSNFLISRISNDMLDAPTAIKDHCQQQQINNNKDVDSKNEQVSELTDANDSQEIEKETLRSKNNSKKKPRGRLGKKRKVADRSGNKTKNNRQTKTVSNKKKVEKGKASLKIATKCTSDDQLDHELSNNEVETTQTKPETSNEGSATDDQVAGKWCLSNFLISRISNDMLDAPTAIKDHCQQQQINNNKDVDSKNEQVSELTDANDSQEIEKETLRSKNNSKKKPRGRLGKKRKVADRSGNKTKNNRQTKTVSNKKKVEKGKASLKIVTKCTLATISPIKSLQRNSEDTSNEEKSTCHSEDDGFNKSRALSRVFGNAEKYKVSKIKKRKKRKNRVVRKSL